MYSFTRLRPVTALLGLAGLFVFTAAAPRAEAQDNPVYVNDSPAALAMLRQAEDQVRDNPGEAIRLFQTLLDSYPMKLVPLTDEATDQFISVRQRILRTLRSSDSLRERYALVATPEAQRMLESRQLERLAVTRPLTLPGLQAMLSLAQEEFESAHFDAALVWLSQAIEHPKCSDRFAAHAWYMTAVSQHYRGDADAMKEARQQLPQTGETGQRLLAELQRIIADNASPKALAGRNVLSHTTTGNVDDLIAQPIWTTRLDQSLLMRRFVDPNIPESRHSPVLDQRRREADLMTAAATVCGNLIYVNEGYRLVAYDRYMGDARWMFVDTPSIASLDRDNDPPLDLNIVAAHGSSLITFTGHAHSDHRSGSGSVVCLNRLTGERRWQANLDALGGDETDGLYPHGEPIIADGAVLFVARKVSPQRLASTYAVALDLETGRMRWMRYLTSSGGLQRSGRPISSATYDNGWLYVATPIGAVARLDSTTGEIDWLRRFGVPMNVPFQDQMRRPWEFSAPVVTASGVLALQPDQRRISLLDTHSGDVLQTYPASANSTWGEVRYLLSDEKHVYAIGRDIRAFPVDGLTQPIWTLPPPATSRMVDDDMTGGADMSQRLDLRGRVQLAQGMLIAPALQGLLFIDSETGQVNHRLNVLPGNPVVTDSQLFYASSDQLDAYMSFDRAQNMLRARIEDDPTDPAPALSLLRLAIRVGDMGLTLSAAELAHHAVQMEPVPNRSARAQAELFNLLISVDRELIAESPTQGEALFAMLGTVSRTSLQQVQYLLSYGDWLADRDVAQAVEVYQRLLSDDELAFVECGDDQLTRSAWRAATQRLRQLLARRGERVYAAQADFAQRQLEELLASSRESAPADLPEARPGAGNRLPTERLMALAREFPFCKAGEQAAVQAALREPRAANAGDVRDAVAMLVQQYQRTLRARSASVLMGLAVQLCAEAEWDDEAARLLAEVRRRHGDIELVVVEAATGEADAAGGVDARRTVSQWQRMVGQPGRELAAVGRPDGQVREVMGTLLEIGEFGDGAQSLQEFVTTTATSVAMFRAGDGEALWRVELEAVVPGANWQPTAVLRQDSRGVVILLRDDGADAMVVMLGAADGRVVWRTPRLSEIFGDAEHEMIRATELSEQMPSGEPFKPEEVIAAAVGDRVTLVRRIGQVASFWTGQEMAIGVEEKKTNIDARVIQPQWRVTQTLDQVHHVAMLNSSLVMMGVQRGGRNANGSKAVMTVINSRTGRMVSSVRLADDEPAAWMRLGPLGRVVYGSASGVGAIDVYLGERAWTNRSYEARGALAGWLVENTAVVQCRSRELRSLVLDDGEMTEPFDGPLRTDEWDPYDLEDVLVVGDRLYALYPQRVVRYSPSGRIFGQDVVTDERDFRWVVPAADQLLAISVSSSQAMTPDEAGRRLQYTYRIYRMNANCKLLGDAVDLPAQTARAESVRALNGWLALGLAEPVTRLVPMPVRDGEP